MLAVLLMSLSAGCNGTGNKGRKELLTIDFQKDQTLRYKFVSTRNIEVDWGGAKEKRSSGCSTCGGGKPKSETPKTDNSSESVEMVFAYSPVEAEPYGLTTIKATCESVKTVRSARSGKGKEVKDAIEYLPGRTFTFTVEPSGKIEDYSKMDELIRDIGKKAFRPSADGRRTKDPDMIGDFVVTQWFLWDSISSIEKPIKGVSPGQSWKSRLSVPVPMVMRKARDVTYTLDGIRESKKGRLAVIRSSYSLADSVPNNWPVPYSGGFQMSGTFGFLRNYKVMDLQGQGEELFNIDTGRTERYEQQYQMQMEASLRLPIGTNPKITVKQHLTMQLLEN